MCEIILGGLYEIQKLENPIDLHVNTTLADTPAIVIPQYHVSWSGTQYTDCNYKKNEEWMDVEEWAE